LKNAIGLTVLTSGNLLALLMNDKTHETLYLLSIVIWRVASQPLNVRREARIRLLEIARDVATRRADFNDSCNLPYHAGFGERTFFWCKEDIEKLLVSLVVVGVIATLSIPRITIGQTGTMDLAHRSGVTRLQMRENNHDSKIIRELRKSVLSMHITETWRLVPRWNRLQNFAWVHDGMLGQFELQTLDNWFFQLIALGNSLLTVTALPSTHPMRALAFLAFGRCPADFVTLLGLVKDGQRPPTLAYLGGTSIMGEIKAIAKSGWQRFSWTVAHQDRSR
jgi:hypothetical protein